MSRCCVPNCESVFTRTEGINPERIGLFRLPTNPERRELWKRLIKLNRPLAPSDRVCSLHFASDSIKRYYESKSADGSVKILPRSKLTLGASAVPTIFPNSSKTPVIKIPKLNNENGGKSISRRNENSENTRKTIPRRTENSKRTISRITENSKESTSRETEISEKSNSRITESSEKATSRGTENRNFALRDEPPALQVYLRVKPTPSFENSTEILVNKLICRPPIQSKLFDSTTKSEFTFARIFDSETSQQEVFRRTMLPCVGDLIRSRNSLVFSYGTVNSGKSYTIQGNVANPGLLPRTLHAIFSKIEIQKEIRYVPDMVSNVNRISAAESVNELQRLKDLFKAHPSMKMYETQYHRLSQNFDDYSEYEIDRLPKCSMWVSFVEVYKEMVYDLLEPVTGNTRSQLKLCTDEDDNFYVKGLKQFCVQNAAEAYATYMFGKQNFNTSCTNMDKTASRSHCIFTIKLVNLSDPEFLTISRLSICDLAGSGKPKEARSNDGKSIDLSLFMLNRCLKTLRDNQTGDSSHTMPYRSAKLTQLLCSLFTEKNCEKVVMIVNINPSPDMFDETIEVLNVSAIARQIRRNPNASEKTIKHRRQSPSRNQYSSDDVDHRSFGLGMLNRDKESHDVEAQNMQQQIEQLKEEVKRKEGQIEDIHAKYQEMLKYMVKFHEEEVGQIKKESQQEADQRIQAIKAYYDLKINEISSTNNTYREMPIIEDSPTKLRERIIRPDEPAQIYDDMVIDEPSNDDSIEVVENNLPPSIPQQCNVPKQYSNPNSTVRNVDNRTSSWRSVGTTPQQNTPTRAKDSPVLNANAGNTTRTPTPSVQPAKKAENQYRIIATNSRLNVNKLNASNNLVAGLPAGISAQDLAEKKFKIFKLNNPLSATGAIPIVRRVIAPYQGMKTSPNLASSQNCTPERPASVASLFHVVKNTPSVQPNETKLIPSADTDKCSPIASSVAANLVNSPTGKAERVYPNVAPRFQVIKATPHVIRTPLVDAIKRPVSMPSPPVVKFAANFKSYRISAVGKSDAQAPASVQQRNLQRDGVFETYQHVIANQTNSTDNKNFKSEISVLPGNVQSKSATAGVVVIQVKPDGSGKPVGENNANINPKSAEVDVQCKQTANVETRPNENTNQSLSTSQTSDTSVSTKQMAVDGDTPLVNDHQDDVRDNDDVLVISDDTDEEDTYKGIDDAQIIIAPKPSWQIRPPKKFICQYCDKEFPRNSGLRMHIKRHFGIKPFKCDKCSAAFTEQYALTLHKRRHLVVTRLIKCNNCDQSFLSKGMLARHIKENHAAIKPGTKCDFCEKIFLTETMLLAHMNKHFGVEPVKCGACDEEFADQDKFYRHFKIAHRNRVEPVIERDGNARVESNDPVIKSGATRPKKCEYCGKKFSSFNTLKYHIRRHLAINPYKCVECYKTFVNKKELRRHANTHREYRKFKCEKCGEEFLILSSLRLHERKHSESKPFKCETCWMSFHTEMNLKRHEKIHSQEISLKPFVCVICSKEFSNEEHLEEHTNMHLGTEPLKCNERGKTSTRKPKLDGQIDRRMGEPIKRYQCTECDESFHRYHIYKAHVNIHLDTKSYRCKVCEKKFYSRAGLRCHNLTHNADKIVYKCPRCCKSYASRLSLRIHNKRQHFGFKSFKCLTCKKKFAFVYELKNHSKIHSNVKKFDCSKCNRCFASKSEFTEHKKIHLDVVASESSNSFAVVELDQRLIKVLDNKSHKCDKCGKQFASKYRLEIHMRRHSVVKPFQCAVCGLRFYTRAELQQHNVRHLGAKPHKCVECIKEFFTRSELRQHTLRVHLNMSRGRVRYSSTNLLKCSVCGMEFSSQLKSTQHALTVHPGIKTFECNLCFKKFVTVMRLNRHIKTHSKSYKCSICGSSFVYRSELERHERIMHKDVKCKRCNEKFASLTELNEHYNNAHKDIAKLYQCSHCDQKFMHASYLKKHVKVHALGIRRYKCSQCKPVKKFSSVDRFISHTREHLGIMPFSCKYCNKTFSSAGNLKYHVQKHLNLKSHECSECGKKFNAYINLYQHYRVHYKPFQCDVCKHFFAQKFSLKLHIIRRHLQQGK